MHNFFIFHNVFVQSTVQNGADHLGCARHTVHVYVCAKWEAWFIIIIEHGVNLICLMFKSVVVVFGWFPYFSCSKLFYVMFSVCFRNLKIKICGILVKWGFGCWFEINGQSKCFVVLRQVTWAFLWRAFRKGKHPPGWCWWP